MKAETVTCDCPSGKSNCIVITIETCCRKTCEGHQKGHSAKTKKGDDVERVASGPLITERQSDEKIKSEGKPKKDKSPSAVKVAEDKPEENEEPEKQAPVPVQEAKDHKLFKLPILVERHHGPGCAMEISVLEKHEDSCMYKKEDVGGRNDVDDRSGSYDCIGRMVFRTCNSNELDSDQSKLGIHASPPGTNPRPAVSKGSDKRYMQVIHPGQREESRQGMPAQRSSHQSEYGSFRSNLAEKGSMSTPRHSMASTINESKYQTADSTTFKTAQRSTDEVPISPSESSKKSREEQVMMAATTTFPNALPFEHSASFIYHDGIKKHYPGDGCKLHPPKNPFVFKTGKLLEQASTSKKVFPVYADEANQTDTTNTTDDVEELPKIRFSQETITSLTEVVKPEPKKKTNFLGSLFRRGSAGRPSSSDSKKRFRKRMDDNYN